MCQRHLSASIAVPTGGRCIATPRASPHPCESHPVQAAYLAFNAGGWPEAVSDEFMAFIQWRDWQQRQALPRWVFIKCDSEPKPLFIDFDNPLSLDALATALKKARVIQVSEMLPTPDELWFNDARGRVCCEIRTTFSPIKQETTENAE